jgi:hypothetical protein
VIFNKENPNIEFTPSSSLSSNVSTVQTFINIPVPNTICFTGNSKAFDDYYIESEKNESGRLIFTSPDSIIRTTLTSSSTSTKTVSMGPTPFPALCDGPDCTKLKGFHAVFIPFAFFTILYYIFRLLRFCFRGCFGRKKRIPAAANDTDDGLTPLRIRKNGEPALGPEIAVGVLRTRGTVTPKSLWNAFKRMVARMVKRVAMKCEICVMREINCRIS